MNLMLEGFLKNHERRLAITRASSMCSDGLTHTTKRRAPRNRYVKVLEDFCVWNRRVWV